ncbi:alpha/beta hydrolase [Rhodococcus aerolatus]
MPGSRAPDPSSVRVDGPWTHRDVHANGIRHHVAEIDGGGPLVLLLHGFPEFWWSWSALMPALAEAGARVVAVDLRGYGDTDKPPRGYDGWTLSGDVSGLVRALGETDAVVVGADWGGLIGWATAALHPRVVRGLVVVGAPHPVTLRRTIRRDPRHQGRALRGAVGFQLPWRPERRLVADGAAAVEDVLRAWSGPGWRQQPSFARVARRDADAFRIPGVVHSAMEYYRWAVRSQVRAEGHRFATDASRPVEVPVVAVHGELDPVLLLGTTRRSAAFAPAMELRALPGVGHFPHHEAPDAVHGAVLDVLRGG